MSPPDGQSDDNYIQDYISYHQHTVATRFENLSNADKRAINQQWKIYKSKQLQKYSGDSLIKSYRAGILSGTKENVKMSLEAIEFLKIAYPEIFKPYKIQRK